jgi:two-component system response regulator DevR
VNPSKDRCRLRTSLKHPEKVQHMDSTIPITLLLVDDHMIVRVGLRTVFEDTTDIRVVGEAGSVAEAVDLALSLKPDVVLMDMRLPDGTGVDACRQILAGLPETHVVFLTSYEDEEAIFSAVFAGARGFLLKEIGSDSLVASIRAVAAGQSILDPTITRDMAEKLKTLSRSDLRDRTGESLSTQEKRVLTLVADGKTNKEIGTALGLSDKTVKNHLSNIFQKLQVGRRAHAAAVFRQLRAK